MTRVIALVAGRRSSGSSRRRQAGIALLATLTLLGLLLVVMVLGFTQTVELANERQRRTAQALAKAKEALIGYAVGVDVTTGAFRPGDLPCPDTDNNGQAEGSCGNASGSTGQTNRLGRIPWKTLQLEDLRDGDGERLWYAVSNNFKNNTRTTCSSPGDTGCLNSDSRGTITVRDRDGSIVYDGSNPDPHTPSGAIAVVIAPGPAIRRQGSPSPQDRSSAGINVASNYLDVDGVSGEDNADFVDGSAADGFINGPIYDAAGNIISNDRVLPLTYADLMPLLERRVAKEVHNCLTSYAADLQNNGRYPWAADMTASASSDYSDQPDTRFGRIPDTLDDTQRGGGGIAATAFCSAFPGQCMTDAWTPSCTITAGSWWTNWKEQVLYAVADAYQPAFAFSGGVPGASCGSCLTVDPPSSSADKRFVLMVAGKRLASVAAGQPRGSAIQKAQPGNYLEEENDWTVGIADTFSQKPAAGAFNDTSLYQ